MANQEGIVMDPAATFGPALDLNASQTAVYVLEQLDWGIASRRPNWLQGPEGSLLAEDPPYDDAQGTATVRIQPAVDGDMDGALTALGVLAQKMQECSASGSSGMQWQWTPSAASAAKAKFACVKLCEFDGAPPIEPSGDLAGWFVQKPVVKIKFTRSPLLLDPEYTSWADNFAANSLANYTVDAGAAGNLAISAGTLNVTANPTVEERLVWTAVTTAVPYPKLWGDLQATLKFTVGTTVTSFKAGVVLKRIAANSYLVAYVDDNGTNSRLRLDVVTAGTVVNRSSTNLVARITASTAFWIRARIEGSTVYLEYWTAAPTATGTPTLTASYALAGAEITNFGQGVQGYAGIDWIPQQTAATLDDFTVDPNVWVSSNPLLAGTLPNVPGDADALGRLIVTDRANQARRYLEWGLEQRYLAEEMLANGGVMPPLQIDSASLATSGFAGTSTTRAGSFNANVIRATLSTQPTAVCGTGNLKHIGSFRVRGRIYASAAGVRARLSYQDGSGIFRALEYQAPTVSAGFADVDFGIVTINKAPTGTQQWSGRVEALTDTAGDTIDVDYLELIPVERYGKARAAYSYTSGALVGRDDFTGLADAAVLNARVAPSGGTWATSGVATDFVGGAPATVPRGQSITRTSASDATPRFAILGTSTFTDTEAGLAFRCSSYGAGNPEHRVVTRYVDGSNYAYAGLRWSGAFFFLEVHKVVAGTDTTVASTKLGLAPSSVNSIWFQVALIVYPSGIAVARLLDASGSLVASATGTDSALATGGALASGKTGIAMQATFGGARYFDDFYAAVPTAEPIVLYGGRVAEIRPDSAIRQDSAGAAYGPIPSYRGGRFFVPNAGAAGRTTRLTARAVRNDVEAATYDNPSSDALMGQVALTPRALLPR